MNLFLLATTAILGTIAVTGVKVAQYSSNIVHGAAASHNSYHSHSPFYRSSSPAPSYDSLSEISSPAQFVANNYGQSYFGNYQPKAEAYHASPFGSIYSNRLAPEATQTCGVPLTQCVKGRYRTLDGSCNNLVNPTWGTANSRYSRLLSPKYGDGVSTPTVSVTGEELPGARLVSLVVFGEEDRPDPQFTLVNMQWGQIMTHDMSMLAGSTQSKKHATRCCTDDGKLISRESAAKSCYPILIPPHDPAHSQTGTECMNFVRTVTDKDRNCPGSQGHTPAEQLTVVTPFLDLSIVYGSSEEQGRPIRAYQNGRMIVEQRNGQEWPPSAPNASASCDVETQNEVCYLAGDVRVNQNTGLTILQIMLLREHNRIADKLQALNPHWDDDTVYQETRRINIAEYQHISYYEWLPFFLGQDNMINNRLLYKSPKGSFVNDYNPSIDPSVINSHATAAFRYFHSQIEGRLDLISEIRSRTGSLRLSDWLNRPSIIEAGDNYDSLARGLGTQPMEDTDINFDAEIKHYLFRGNRPFGRDLRALDIQRNRDHGLASYNDFREFCGLRRGSSWEDFLDLISQKDIENLKSLYTSHEDLDLTVGASLETHVAGALAGPTFLCILTEQFYRTRVGDRFWYERGDKDIAFSREQLNEIRKATMARLLCDNGNNIHSIQPSAFERISERNQIQPCAAINEINLSYWQEIPNEYPSHKYYSHDYKK